MDTVKYHGESPQVGGCVKGGGGVPVTCYLWVMRMYISLGYKIYYAGKYVCILWC